MGVTGSGKSTFINQYLGEDAMLVNHGLYSCTQEIEYNTGTKITGLVYLHNIADPRMGAAALLSYNLFRRMCGVDALSRVVLATTNWEEVQPQTGNIREQDLKAEFWAEALANGACYRRIQTPQRDVADTIDYILAHFEATATQIQKELIDSGRRVAQTDAGKTLQQDLHRRRFGFQAPSDQGRLLFAWLTCRAWFASILSILFCIACWADLPGSARRLASVSTP
ncbi:hypothetical protein MD484_g4772, partial [Candolleomyces efflorescens]